MFNKIALAACLLVAAPLTAESVKGSMTASNGLTLTTYIDDFAGRAEYSSPPMKFKMDTGYMESIAFVSRTKQNGEWTPVQLIVLAAYRGDWRFYDSAIFRGGEKAEFLSVDRKVLSCSGSRYGGACSHSESMYITVTPEQLSKYGENGMLPIQIRGRAAGGNVVQVPVAHFEAMFSLDGPIPAPAPVEAPATATPQEPQAGVTCVTCN